MNKYQSKKIETALKQLDWAWHNITSLEVECRSISKHPEDAIDEEIKIIVTYVMKYKDAMESLKNRLESCENYTETLTYHTKVNL